MTHGYKFGPHFRSEAPYRLTVPRLSAESILWLGTAIGSRAQACDPGGSPEHGE